MIKKQGLLMLFLLFSVICFAQEKPLVAGMKISRSVKIKRSEFRLNAPADLHKSVILIQGNNLVIDFNQAVLNGSDSKKMPDEFSGVAIIITNSKNITIKNLKAKGYKIALLARNVQQLTIENCDFSYNYRPRLNSTQEKEDISDWMSYHHNEKDEWMRYGAAMYLRDCFAPVVRNTKVTGGQNALMMTGCDKGKIYYNDFSFNSGIGIGMYRCNSNEVSFNKINFNVRGYSHGVYNRGQDSAGILVYEQSNYNVFYKNSVTHGGDGFFLWAGQTTMDSGKGGCNDNLLWDNDFSYAPTNGIEVTFSRNRIDNNRIFECDHGIWGGYSYSTIINNNQFRDNRIAIAIEHGQKNQVIYNLFSKDKEAIRLWARKQQPADWGYAKNRDTRSVNYVIAGNSFNGNSTAISVALTDSLYMFSNTYSGHDVIFKKDSALTFTDIMEREIVDTTLVLPEISSGPDPFKGSGKLAGRKNIRMTEWGPHDYRSPIIWNTNPTTKSDTMFFNLIAPGGKWKIIQHKGVKLVSKKNGVFPDSIFAIKNNSPDTDISIDLEYTGPAIVTPMGRTNSANKPYRFSFTKYFKPINFEVLFYSLDTINHNPIKSGSLFSPLERKAPFKTENVNKIDYAWWGGIKGPDQQHRQFITVAEGSADFEKGLYEIGVTWDDAVRVYVDEKLIIDEWNPSRYTFDESPHKKLRLNLGGRHNIRVEHIELGGFATLSLKIKKL